MTTYRTPLSVLAALLLVGTLARPTPVAARWEASVEQDDFGSKHVGIAITMQDGRALGLRCENERVPSLVFATRETWGDGLAPLPAKLLIKVDDQAPESRPAVLEQYPMIVGLTQQLGVRVLATGDHLFPILDAIARAKTRVAVAVEIAGQRFENTRFSSRGSRAAFKRIWHFCGSKFGTYTKPDL